MFYLLWLCGDHNCLSRAVQCSIDGERLSQTAGGNRLESAGQAKVLVEGIVGRLSAQELFQSDHFFLAATPFEYSVPVPPTLLSIQGIRLECSVEHVRGIDLGRQVTVVASVVAPDKMAESCWSIAPIAM